MERRSSHESSLNITRNGRTVDVGVPITLELSERGREDDKLLTGRLREGTASSEVRSHQAFLFGTHLVVQLLHRRQGGQFLHTERRAKRWTISPENAVRHAWVVWMDVLVMYSVGTSLFYLAFEGPGSLLHTFDTITWVMFIVNLFLSFLTQYENDRGQLVLSRRLIARHYFSTWFLLDFLPLIPYSMFTLPEVEYYHRLIRVFRLREAINFQDGTGIGAIFSMLIVKLGEVEIFGYKFAFVHLMKVTELVVKLLLLSYFLACFFYWYANLLRDADATSKLWFGSKIELKSTTGGKKLLHSWYFMLTTLVTLGYGDEGPANAYEQLMMVVVLLVGIGNYSIIMGSFVSLVDDIQKSNSRSDHTQDFITWMEILEYACDCLPTNTKHRIVQEYTAYIANDRLGPLAINWWQCESTEELLTPTDEMYVSLPGNLRKEVLDDLFGDMFVKYPQFLINDLRYALCLLMQPRSFQFGEDILMANKHPLEVLLLVSGSVDCIADINDLRCTFMTCKSRMIVGDLEAICQVPSLFTYKAASRHTVVLFALHAQSLLEIITEKYPKLKQELFVQAQIAMKVRKTLLEMYVKNKGYTVHLTRQQTIHSNLLIFRAMTMKKIDPLRQLADLHANLNDSLASVSDAVIKVQSLTATHPRPLSFICHRTRPSRRLAWV